MNPIKSVAYKAVTWALSDRWDALPQSVRNLFEGWGAVGYAPLAKLTSESPYGGRALRLIAEAMASAPIIVRSGEDDEVATTNADILTRPGGSTDRRMTKSRLMEMIVWALYCGGDFYAERLGAVTGENGGKAKRLRGWMPTQLEKIDRAADGEPTMYHFKGYKGGRVSVEAERICHISRFNPCDFEADAKGQPILVSAHRAMRQMEASDNWNQSITKNAGLRAGYFAPKSGDTILKSDDVKRLQDGVDSTFEKRKDKVAPLVLSGNVDFHAGSVTPREADALGTRMQSARETSCVTGVPMRLLADDKGGSLTDAGVDSEVRALWLLTVLPLLSFVLEHLSTFLLAEGERFVVDVDDVDALSEDADKKVGRVVRLVARGIISVKEARVEIGYAADIEADMMDPVPEPPKPDEGGQLPPGVTTEDGSTVIRSLLAATDEEFERVLKRAAA